MKYFISQYQVFFTFLGFFLPVGETRPYSIPWDPFLRSSQANADLVAKNYPNEPFQRWVATTMGDEIPHMRDDLIRRKNRGEGIIERHLKAWTTLENWQVDPLNNKKEIEDPHKENGTFYELLSEKVNLIVSLINRLIFKPWLNNE